MILWFQGNREGTLTHGHVSVFDPPTRKCTYSILTVYKILFQPRMTAGRLRTNETHTFPPAEKQIPNPWEGKVLAGYLRVVAPSGEDTAVSPGCRHLAIPSAHHWPAESSKIETYKHGLLINWLVYKP